MMIYSDVSVHVALERKFHSLNPNFSVCGTPSRRQTFLPPVQSFEPPTKILTRSKRSLRVVWDAGRSSATGGEK